MRLRGHRLIAKGAPHTGQTCQSWPCDTVSGVQRVNRTGKALAQGIAGHGHALCECTWTGPHRLTGADRKRDHQDHKQRIRQDRRAA